MTKNTRISTDSKPVRLYYLDWLRVLLIIGVFLFHASQPFVPNTEWHIKDAEQSNLILAVMLAVFPWGLPLLFLIAGAGSRFALRRRSNLQYIGERVSRLLIPFIVGSILLSPVQKYMEALHKGSFQGSFLSFIPETLSENILGNFFTPHLFGRWGLHLWFLGFLFSFSILALPIFNGLKRSMGRRLVARLCRLFERRGGILIAIIPIALSRIALQPFFPEEHGWLDFVCFFIFFVSGYIIYSDERFLSVVRRDRRLLLLGGLISLSALIGIMAATSGNAIDWFYAFVVPWSILLQFVFAATGWCWTMYVLSLAMVHLNFTNKWLAYGNEVIMPFYLFHQPLIIVIAYFAVQWETGILVKLVVVVISSFLTALGLIELLIRHIKPMRMLFGTKSRRCDKEKPKEMLVSENSD